MSYLDDRDSRRAATTPSGHYPEHERLAAIPEAERQDVGDLLTKLSHVGLCVCQIDEDGEYEEVNGVDKVMGVIYGIDLRLIDKEKGAMLAEIREANMRRELMADLDDLKSKS